MARFLSGLASIVSTPRAICVTMYNGDCTEGNTRTRKGATELLSSKKVGKYSQHTLMMEEVAVG